MVTGLKEFCALLLAGGMGASSVVAVQKARPPVAKAKPRLQPAKVQKTAPAASRTSITECPLLPGPSIGPFQMPTIQQDPQLVAMANTATAGQVFQPIAGGSPAPVPTPTAPGIPQPDTWVMLVTGFGFLGAAVRRRPREERHG